MNKAGGEADDFFVSVIMFDSKQQTAEQIRHPDYFSDDREGISLCSISDRKSVV